MDVTTLEALSASVDRLVALARTIDIDLLHGNGEPIGRLVAEARYFAALANDEDAFEISQLLVRELRRRRNLSTDDL